MIYDISVPVRNGMHVWPSDPAVVLETEVHRSGDDSHEIRVTAIHCGSHTGTHLDAPSHMIPDSGTLNDIPLDTLIGPTRVVDAQGSRSIGVDILRERQWDGVERVLFRTDNSLRWTDADFYDRFVYLEPDAAHFLADRGIRLVGIDYLSIDGYRSAGHPAHFVLLSKSIVILEGLDLSKVTAGDYQLVALPLKLDGADGAPVRAVLMN